MKIYRVDPYLEICDKGEKMSIRDRCVEKCIQVRFSLAPQYADAQYKDHLFSFIQKKYEKKTLREYGFIYKIICIQKILHHEIMSIYPNIFFILEIRVLLYYPKIGDRLELPIHKVFEHGIYFIEDKIRIIAPTIFCVPCKVEKDFTSYYIQCGTKIFKRGDTISIELIEIRFEKDGFSCLARLAI